MNWYMEVMRKYAVFSGRARRKEYWMFQLINVLLIVVLFISFALVIPAAVRHNENPLLLFVVLIAVGYVLATIVPSLAVSVRRLHDTNLSGWWVLIGLIPLGGIVLLVMHVLDSTPGPNRYGPNPKGIDLTAYETQYAASRPKTMASAAGAGVAPQSSRWFLGFCNSCGTQMSEGARFCPKCGNAAY